ncbi:hypothetical protein KQX54_021796 [Cotesia glomerata]|uniref:Uncharacterized protein n=1 Tax=Cotesia glomerata TaxID=32391 RepID=A0AAV7IWY0_COTGL|nr:hypothetical protein KQX54_021796 [Cotesia glomerata]
MHIIGQLDPYSGPSLSDCLLVRSSNMSTCVNSGYTCAIDEYLVTERTRIAAVLYQKRLKKERRARKRLQEQLDLEVKRRTQLEEALKATGATPEQVRAIAENVTPETRTKTEPCDEMPAHSQSQSSSSQQQPQQSQSQSSQQSHQQPPQQQAQYRESQVPRPPQQPTTPDAIKPGWGYGLDLIGGQASAFWQNYQAHSSGAFLGRPNPVPRDHN